MVFQIYVPTRLVFGPGSLGTLHEQALPGKKALVVTTGGKSVKAHGYLDALFSELEQAGVDFVLFDQVQANPTLNSVRAGSRLIRSEGCDFVVGLGGGSAIDAAKAMAVMAANPGDLWDYMGAGSGGRKPLAARPLPTVAITTTAGTGTETDPWMVITNEELNEKIGFGNDQTYPCLSIVDPELMLTVPPRLTAYQGFDAFFHVVEGYLNKNHNPIADQMSLQAIGLIARSLPTAVKEGGNLEARTDVALANTLAGYSQSISGTISAHPIEHALSGFHPDLPHGAGLIMTSVAYFRAFLPHEEVHERYIEMARAMGREAERPEDFIDAMIELKAACGVADLKMSDYGVKPDEFPAMLDLLKTLSRDNFEEDPVKLSREDFERIYRDSYR